MRKRIALLFCIILGYHYVFCQKIEGAVCIKKPLDTLNYLKQFEVNKGNYIGQPFSKLLNEMIQIQPKAVWPSPNFAKKNLNYHTNFSFCDIQFSFYNTIMLRIEWQNPLKRIDTKYYQLLNNSLFTNDERNFYGSKIVKDIQVYR